MKFASTSLRDQFAVGQDSVDDPILVDTVRVAVTIFRRNDQPRVPLRMKTIHRLAIHDAVSHVISRRHVNPSLGGRSLSSSPICDANYSVRVKRAATSG